MSERGPCLADNTLCYCNYPCLQGFSSLCSQGEEVLEEFLHEKKSDANIIRMTDKRLTEAEKNIRGRLVVTNQTSYSTNLRVSFAGIVCRIQ